MTTTNPNRISRGVADGGQFATGPRAESEVSLSEAPANIEPWELAEGIAEGQEWDVDQVASRDRWATKQWEEYYDAQHEAEVQAAHSAPTQFEGATTTAFTSDIDGALVVQIDTDDVTEGRSVRVNVNDGVVFDGDPEKHQVARIEHHNPGPAASPGHWDAAQGCAMITYQYAKTQMEKASVGAFVSGVLDSYPDAQHLTLEHSDQGDYYTPDEVWGDDRETIADSDDLDGSVYDLAGMLSNLSSDTHYPFIGTAAHDRQPRMDLHAAMAWAMAEEGTA